MYWPFTHSTHLYGPVAMILVGRSSGFSFAHLGATIGSASIRSGWMGSALVLVTSTVLSSTLVILPPAGQNFCSGAAPSLLAMTPRLYTTASALKSSPLWNLIPLRTV